MADDYDIEVRGSKPGIIPSGASDAPPASESLKFVVCPQCGEWFRLTWNDYTVKRNDDNLKQFTDNRSRYGIRQTLMIRSCPSGGVYDVSIECPHCNYEEEL